LIFKLRLALCAIGALSLAFAAEQASAQTFLPIYTTAQELYISDYGNTVAGNQGNPNKNFPTITNGSSAFLWYSATGMFGPSSLSNVYAISGDGLSAAGVAGGTNIPFYFKEGGTAPFQLDIIPQAFSTNGTYLYSFDDTANAIYSWSPGLGGTELLTLAGQDYPESCSGDGSVLYGLDIDNSVRTAWVWTVLHGEKSIGSFQPWNCSLSGVTVVGTDQASNKTIDYWNPSTGLSQYVLPGTYYVNGDAPVSITADGTIIWGTYKDSTGLTHAYLLDNKTFHDLGPNTAFVNEMRQRGGSIFPGSWVDTDSVKHYGYFVVGSGRVDISQFLTAHNANLAGWSSLQVLSTSEDGDHLCGIGNGPLGKNQGFWVELQPIISSVTLNAPSSTSNKVDGSVTLDNPAPASGAIVTLTSSDPTVASLPPSATVLANLHVGTFVLTFEPVTTKVVVTITATYGSSKNSTTITLAPPSLSAVTTEVPSTDLAQTLGGSVVITGPAPEDLTVFLSSSDPTNASFPPYTEITTGTREGVFAITTKNVLVTEAVTITAKLGTVTRTTILTLNPPDFANPGFETPQLQAGVWETPSSGTASLGQWDGFFVENSGGWGIANGSGSFGVAGHSGSQYAFMIEAVQMGQTISGLAVGHTYQVSFWSAGRDGDVGGNSPCPVYLTANGTTIVPLFTPPGNGQWTLFKSNAFTATSSTYKFVFYTTADGGSDLFDDVHLTLLY
jgi:hypothetical protein